MTRINPTKFKEWLDGQKINPSQGISNLNINCVIGLISIIILSIITTFWFLFLIPIMYLIAAIIVVKLYIEENNI